MALEVIRKIVDGAFKTVVEDPGGGNGGSVPAGSVVPVADPTGATVDTTTYDNPYEPGEKLTTLVFPDELTAAFAIARDGDAYPRWIFSNDPLGSDLLMGDGTVNIYDRGAFIGIKTPNSEGYVPLSLGGESGFLLGIHDPNIGSVNDSDARALQLNGDLTLQASSGPPFRGGNVGDLLFRGDPDDPMGCIYQCTVAGVQGASVWRRMVTQAAFVDPATATAQDVAQALIDAGLMAAS